MAQRSSLGPGPRLTILPWSRFICLRALLHSKTGLHNFMLEKERQSGLHLVDEVCSIHDEMEYKNNLQSQYLNWKKTCQTYSCRTQSRTWGSLLMTSAIMCWSPCSTSSIVRRPSLFRSIREYNSWRFDLKNKKIYKLMKWKIPQWTVTIKQRKKFTLIQITTEYQYLNSFEVI